MENRKCVMMDEALHKRLKTYCASQGISISSYVDNCVHQFLVGDELSIDEKWEELQFRFKNLMRKLQISGGAFLEESDEYKQYISDVEKYWYEKDGKK